jgi:hypothetical protein
MPSGTYFARFRVGGKLVWKSSKNLNVFGRETTIALSQCDPQCRRKTVEGLRKPCLLARHSGLRIGEASPSLGLM